MTSEGGQKGLLPHSLEKPKFNSKKTLLFSSLYVLGPLILGVCALADARYLQWRIEAPPSGGCPTSPTINWKPRPHTGRYHQRVYQAPYPPLHG